MATIGSWKSLPLLLLLLLLALSPSRGEADLTESYNKECLRLDELLSRLSDLVNFYASDPDRVNADGYFGMRLSRDLVSPQPVLAAAGIRCGSPASNRLASVLIRQDLLASRFAENLAGRSGYDGDTFSRICQPMARIFQRLTGAPRSAISTAFDEDKSRWPGEDQAVVQMVTRLVQYDEPRGDACLVEALRTDGECPARSQCPYFDRALEDASGYYLTHQLLYKLVKELNPCRTGSGERKADAEASMAASAELKIICQKALHEFKLIEAANWTKISLKMGNDPVTGLRDLYMEQALLCGLVGAKDFYRRESVDTVTSWQDPQLGCFKLFESNTESLPVVMRRKMLRDVEMLGGCSAHSSGVAMGFYSNAIRFLLGV